MLRLGRTHENLAGKLLLSSALVAVSLAYGWWQRDNVVAPSLAQMPVLPAPHDVIRAPLAEAVAPSTAPAATDAGAAPDAPSAPAEAAHRPRPTHMAMAEPQAKVPPAPAIPEAPLPQNDAAPSPAPLTAEAALQMYLPTEDASPPFPLVTGTPAPGAGAPIPAGTRLEDGDYVSDKHEFEWGDLKVRIAVHGGQIIAVQILQYPDHRSQSLYLSEMAGPTLESEVIKTQQSQVDIVSSATDTSYAFQDTIANAIMKATRGS